MSVALSEKGIVIKFPEPLVRFLDKREINDAVNEAKSQTPQSLHPFLKDYFTDIFRICSSQPVDQMLKEGESLIGKLKLQYVNIHDLRAKINEGDEESLQNLRHQRAATAKKPEPLPKTIRPAVGRLARVSLNVLLGIELPRPDLAPLDREIASIESQLPIHQQLTAMEQQFIDLHHQGEQQMEKVETYLDSWAAQNPTRAIVHLSLNPERLIKILKEYQKRAIKNPSPQEATWYVTWVLSNIEGRNGQNGLLSQMPETSQKWFKSLFPHIPSPSVALSIFARSIEEFQRETWSLLTPPPVDTETVEHVTQNLISGLSTPGFSVSARDFSSFAQWAFVTSAQRIGIFPEDEPVPPPIPEVCQIPVVKHKKEKRKPITEPEPASPERSRGVKEEERQFPVICVSPYNSHKQLFLNPDGTVRLITPEEETIIGFTEETVATVFNLKPQDPKIKMIWGDLQKFQRRFYGLSRSGDIVRLNRPVLPGRIHADLKIRFNGIFIYEMGKGKKGIPTYIIYAYGTHDEVFG